MTQVPPPPAQPSYPPYQPVPPPKTNGWAIASLICGILGCIPIITSLLALIFGVLGMKKANEPATGGKGLAIVGLILGVLGIIGWAGFGAAGYFGYGMAKRMVLQPTEQAGGAFLNSLEKGDISTASNYTTGDMSPAELQALQDQLKKLGNFKSFSLSKFDANAATGNQMHVNIGGVAHFDNGDRGFTASLAGTKTGGTYSFKIEDFKLE